jgi:hypothetical protein
MWFIISKTTFVFFLNYLLVHGNRERASQKLVGCPCLRQQEHDAWIEDLFPICKVRQCASMKVPVLCTICNSEQKQKKSGMFSWLHSNTFRKKKWAHPTPGSTYIIYLRVPQCLSPRPNWDPPPPPLPQASVSPHPPEPKGEGNTLACGRGGGPNSDDWRKSLVLSTLFTALTMHIAHMERVSPAVILLAENKIIWS